MSNQDTCTKSLKSLRDTAPVVLDHMDDLWKQLIIVRSLTPYLADSLVGRCAFETAPWYKNKGYEATACLHTPMTAEFIDETNLATHAVNQGFVIRLCAYLEYCGVYDAYGVDKQKPDVLRLLKLLRNQFAHTNGLYQLNDKSKRAYRMLTCNGSAQNGESPLSAKQQPGSALGSQCGAGSLRSVWLAGRLATCGAAQR